MNLPVCRTCMEVVTSPEYIPLRSNDTDCLTIANKLMTFVPELALHIAPNAVICSSCAVTINVAYEFKKKCLKNEELIQNFVQTVNPIRTYIDLHQVLGHANESKDDFGIKPGLNRMPMQNATLLNRKTWKHSPVLVKIETQDSVCADYSFSHNKTNKESVCPVEFEKSCIDDMNCTTDLCVSVADAKEAELLEKTDPIHTRNDGSGSTDIIRLEKAPNEDHNFPKNVYNDWLRVSDIPTFVGNVCPKEPQISEPISSSCAAPLSYRCVMCSKCFKSQMFLDEHMKSHFHRRGFRCDYCNYTTSHKVFLIIHTRTHTGEKPYRCETCFKCFSQSSNLKTHMRTHTGERPFRCLVCRKCFSYNSNLKTHMRTHNIEELMNFKLDVNSLMCS